MSKVPLGGKFKHECVAYFPLSTSAKKIENRLIFGEVMDETIVLFFYSRCRYDMLVVTSACTEAVILHIIAYERITYRPKCLIITYCHRCVTSYTSVHRSIGLPPQPQRQISV